MADKTFAKGMIVKKPSEEAPEWVIANVSIKVEEFIPFLQDHAQGDGWVNLNVKEGKSGKYYAELNQWTKDEPREEKKPADDIPF